MDIIDPVIREHLSGHNVSVQVWVAEGDRNSINVILTRALPDRGTRDPLPTIEDFFNLRGLTDDQARSYLDCGAHAMCIRAMRAWHLFDP
jgi:hypothetical protein